MKKKEAKIFKKYGEGKIKMLKDFQPKTLQRGITTVAIRGTQTEINRAIGNCILNGSENERNILGRVLYDFIYEDIDFNTGKLIKY